MNTENKLGKKIKELRKSKGFTQEKLAELANIDAKHLSKIENGVHTPSYNTLKKLSDILYRFRNTNGECYYTISVIWKISENIKLCKIRKRIAKLL